MNRSIDNLVVGVCGLGLVTFLGYIFVKIAWAFAFGGA